MRTHTHIHTHTHTNTRTRACLLSVFHISLVLSSPFVLLVILSKLLMITLLVFWVFSTSKEIWPRNPHFISPVEVLAVGKKQIWTQDLSYITAALSGPQHNELWCIPTVEKRFAVEEPPAWRAPQGPLYFNARLSAGGTLGLAGCEPQVHKVSCVKRGFPRVVVL